MQQPLLTPESNALVTQQGSTTFTLLEAAKYLVGITGCGMASIYYAHQLDSSERIKDILAECSAVTTPEYCGGTADALLDTLSQFNPPGTNAFVCSLVAMAFLLKSAYSEPEHRSKKLIAAMAFLLVATGAAITVYFAKKSQIELQQHISTNFPPTDSDLMHQAYVFQDVSMSLSAAGMVLACIGFFGGIAAATNQFCTSTTTTDTPVTRQWRNTHNTVTPAPINYGATDQRELVSRPASPSV